MRARLLAFAISASALLAQEEPPNFRARPKHVTASKAIVVDREAGRVELRIESTGIAARETCEYLVVGPNSSHGYESLFWAHASASDVRKALALAGIPAGAPNNPSQLRFWGKGERVTVFLREDGASPMPIGRFLVDANTGRDMPELSFIFTGSALADKHDAQSILPAYNESASAFDLARRAAKDEVYGRYVVNPNLVWPAHTLATLVLQHDANRSMRELTLDIAANSFVLRESDGTPLNAKPSFAAMLASCYALIEAETTPYVSVRFDGALPLAKIAEFAGMLSQIDVDHAMRIEPPAENQLYYRAFLPDPEWRDPASRSTQPWELHLAADSATLVRQELTWTKGASKPEIRRQEIPLADSANLPPDGLSVLLVFAAPNLSYSQLLKFVAPFQKPHSTIYVFL